MKTRSMNVDPDVIDVEGNAWSKELPRLVFKQYDNGQVVRKVSIPLRPVDIESVASALWELHGKYQKALEDMTRRLKNS